MLEFNKRILFVGFGAVARCTLPILVKHVKVPPANVTIMDFEPNEAALRPWLEQGMTFVKDRITPDNLGQLLGRYLAAGDLLVDLAWNIACCEIVQWCHDHGVLYVNTCRQPKQGAQTVRVHVPVRQAISRRGVANLRRLKEAPMSQR